MNPYRDMTYDQIMDQREAELKIELTSEQEGELARPIAMTVQRILDDVTECPLDTYNH